MANIYNRWCEFEENVIGRKQLLRLTEANDGRDEVLADLADRVTEHYASDEEIADWVEVLGYETAARCIREEFPEGTRGKSADLGEILASEFIEEHLGYVVPVKKLRDKDHREMAMRGEDVIGVAYDQNEQLLLLKGEAKSAQALSAETVISARNGLEKDGGRPSAHSLIFIGRRLLKSDDDDEKEMGADLMHEAVNSTMPKTRLGHYLFTMSGNPATDAINTDFNNADGGRDQHSVNLRIPDHANFVAAVYEKVVNRGND